MEEEVKNLQALLQCAGTLGWDVMVNFMKLCEKKQLIEIKIPALQLRNEVAALWKALCGTPSVNPHTEDESFSLPAMSSPLSHFIDQPPEDVKQSPVSSLLSNSHSPNESFSQLLMSLYIPNEDTPDKPVVYTPKTPSQPSAVTSKAPDQHPGVTPEALDQPPVCTPETLDQHPVGTPEPDQPPVVTPEAPDQPPVGTPKAPGTTEPPHWLSVSTLEAPDHPPMGTPKAPDQPPMAVPTDSTPSAPDKLPAATPKVHDQPSLKASDEAPIHSYSPKQTFFNHTSDQVLSSTPAGLDNSPAPSCSSKRPTPPSHVVCNHSSHQSPISGLESSISHVSIQPTATNSDTQHSPNISSISLSLSPSLSHLCSPCPLTPNCSNCSHQSSISSPAPITQTSTNDKSYYNSTPELDQSQLCHFSGSFVTPQLDDAETPDSSPTPNLVGTAAPVSAEVVVSSPEVRSGVDGENMDSRGRLGNEGANSPESRSGVHGENMENDMRPRQVNRQEDRPDGGGVVVSGDSSMSVRRRRAPLYVASPEDQEFSHSPGYGRICVALNYSSTTAATSGASNRESSDSGAFLDDTSNDASAIVLDSDTTNSRASGHHISISCSRNDTSYVGCKEDSTDVSCDSGDSRGGTVNSCVGGRDDQDDGSACVGTSSEDDSDEEKLEQMFSQIKLRTTKKFKLTPKMNRSLSSFIVSDSEELSADENTVPIHPPLSPISYPTPCTPTSGIMFWGSPKRPDMEHVKMVECTERKPLTPKNQPIPKFQAAATEIKFPSTPMTRPLPQAPFTVRRPLMPPRNYTAPLGPVTTPSANKNFTRFKNTMVSELFKAFNKSVFDEKLPTDTLVTWNKRLRTTAGMCCYLGTESCRTVRIELSLKVVDSYDRIRSTLVHEMCHAATWVVDGVKGEGHGPRWKAWADRVKAVHPELEQVSRCHSYQIAYKHNYKCARCDYRLGRHSKSVDLKTTRCPYCNSFLEYVPRLRADGTPVVKKPPNKYAQFVKDHYHQVKSNSPWRDHKDIMEKLIQFCKFPRGAAVQPMERPIEKITFRYLSFEDVLKVGLTMADVMDLCSESFTQHALGKVENPPKPGVHPLPDAFLHAMPAFLEELKIAGIKWVSGFPTNVSKKLPSIVGTIVLNDCETGYPTAVMDGTYITAIRTGAASGITAKYFARPDSEVLCIIGTGVQGMYNTLCMLHLLKNLKTIQIFDSYAPSITKYIDQIKPYIGDTIKIQETSSYEEAMKNADVVITATGTLHEAVFFDKWVKPGALVLAVHRHGWNDDVLANMDKVVVDDFDQFKALVTYKPFPDAPYAEMGDVVTGKKTGRENDQERVISFNCGLAIHDMVVAGAVLEKAKKMNLGVELDLMDVSKPPPLPKIS